MNDTRDTLISRLKETCRMVKANNEMGDDVHPEDRPAPRFKKGDILLAAYALHMPFELEQNSFWDREFQGWLIAPGFCGVHESNFILESEKDDWVPHEDGLWSWWERR
jgi:hypothetical protein